MKNIFNFITCKDKLSTGTWRLFIALSMPIMLIAIPVGFEGGAFYGIITGVYWFCFWGVVHLVFWIGEGYNNDQHR